MERNKQPSTNYIFYDIKDEPLSLSVHLFNLLLKEDQFSNLYALYCFYYYTAKWQRSSTPKATTHYTAKGMNWSIEKVRRTKNRLKELNLIEDIVQYGPDGKIRGHFIRINLIWNNENHPPGKPPGGFHDPKCFKNINKRDKKIIIPPSIEEIKQYCQERKNNVDPQGFYDFYQSKGWFVGKNKMKDWQAAIRTWERNDNSNSSNTKNKPKFIRDPDLGRFDLHPDGEYYHCTSGERYIP